MWNAYTGPTKPQYALKNILQYVKKQKQTNKTNDFWLVVSESAAFVGAKVHRRSRTRERKRETTWITSSPLLKETEDYILYTSCWPERWEISTSLEAKLAAPAVEVFPPIGFLFTAIPWPFTPRKNKKLMFKCVKKKKQYFILQNNHVPWILSILSRAKQQDSPHVAF